MDTHVLDNLVTLPAFYFSLIYAFAIFYHTYWPRRRTQTKEDIIISIILSGLCIVVEFITIFLAWTHWIETLQLVEVVSSSDSSPFLWYDLSKFIELSCVLLQIRFTNCDIKHVYLSIDIPMFILADYAFYYSNVQPMIILILFNSVIQIMVHFSHIVENIEIRDMQENCWCLTEAYICCYKTLENIVLFGICFIGWYKFEYVGFNIILYILLFCSTTICCSLITSARENELF